MKAHETARWHGLQIAEAVELLDTDLDKGLLEDEAKIRLAKYGPNRVTRRPGTPAWKRFLLQFHQPLIYMLLLAGAITGGLGEIVDSSVIFGVVLVNAIVGYLQESKAEKAIDSLSRLARSDAAVRRDGKRRRVPSEELVPGDVVLLETGDRVPADLRLTAMRELRVDESTLTGESLPVQKHPDTIARDAMLADYKKGAAERLLERCALSLDERGALVPLDFQEVHRVIERMARKGLRVLAFASRQVTPGQQALEHGHVAEGLTFLGLQGMIDPPRPEAMAAVERCRRAGIQVKMITGDHLVTARAIALQFGLVGDSEAVRFAVSGRELELLMRTGLVSLLMLAAAFGIFFWESHDGATVAQARTATVNVIIFVGIFYLFNCRSLVHSHLVAQSLLKPLVACWCRRDDGRAIGLHVRSLYERRIPFEPAGRRFMAAFDRCGIRSVNDRRFREAAARASRGRPRVRRYFGTGGAPDLTYAYCSTAQS